MDLNWYVKKMGITIIGIDCAVQDKNVGLALAVFDEDRIEARIEDVRVGNGKGSVVKIVAPWIRQYRPRPALLALDAPLGWPVGLRHALRGHKAGKPIRLKADPIFKPKEENAIFRRTTDEVVGRKYKTPLDVGADRIARTAYAALDLLRKLRNETRQEIRLAWKPGIITGTYAIEAYPAGTLKAHRIDAPGYKEKEAQNARQALLDQLKPKLGLPSDPNSQECLENSGHALDAAICVLAGVDFLRGEVYEPKDAGVSIEIAKKEGWIWVKKSEGARSSE